MREWPENPTGGLNGANAWLGNAELDASLFDTSWRNRWQTDRLVVLVRDPVTIFIYWDVSDSRRKLICEHFQSSWASLPFELVVFNAPGTDASQVRSPVRRQTVTPQQTRAYIHELAPRGSFIVDLTTNTIYGKPFTILRSDPVFTPPLPNPQCGAPRALFAKVGEQRARLWVHGQQMTASLATQTVSREDPGTPYAEQFDGYTVRTAQGGAKV